MRTGSQHAFRTVALVRLARQPTVQSVDGAEDHIEMVIDEVAQVGLIRFRVQIGAQVLRF